MAAHQRNTTRAARLSASTLRLWGCTLAALVLLVACASGPSPTPTRSGGVSVKRVGGDANSGRYMVKGAVGHDLEAAKRAAELAALVYAAKRVQVGELDGPGDNDDGREADTAHRRAHAGCTEGKGRHVRDVLL